MYNNTCFDDILNDLPPDYFYKYMLILNKKQNGIPRQLDKFIALEKYIIKNNLLGKGSFNNPKKLLELIDLKKMTPKEFISGPGNSSILDWKTKYDSLAQLVTIWNQYGNRGYY